MTRTKMAGTLAAGALAVLAGAALAGNTVTLTPVPAGTTPAAATAPAGHDHAHDDVYRGYFQDDQIRPRTLVDWQGDWQSVYPLLVDGTLDTVMAHKAEHGDQTAAEYRAYYDTGYRTDVGRIVIDGDKVTFHGPEGPVSGTYADDGYEVLTYKKGSRGVRFIFTKVAGDAAAPQVIQFSDHRIAPEVSDHFHLYWGADRADLLEEVTNWPTYFPSSLTAAQIVDEMMAH